MNPLTVLTHAVLVGLTPLIPLPVLDDLVKSFFYRNLVRSLATSHGVALDANEINVLSEERGRGCLNGCLFGLVEFLVKRFVRKLIFVLEWQRAIDLVTRTYYAGYLLDYTFQQGWYTPGDAARAARLRIAIEQAYGSANTDLVRNVVRASFNHSRSLIVNAVQQLSASLKDIAFRRGRTWLRRQVVIRLRQFAPGAARRLYRGLRPGEDESAQAIRLENNVAQHLERDTPHIRSALDGLLAQMQGSLSALPQEHFTALEARLEKSLKSAGL